MDNKTEDFLRDEKSNALINKNINALSAYKKQREAKRQMNERLNNLEKSVDDIKSMLKEIVKKI